MCQTNILKFNYLSFPMLIYFNKKKQKTYLSIFSDRSCWVDTCMRKLTNLHSVGERREDEAGIKMIRSTSTILPADQMAAV